MIDHGNKTRMIGWDIVKGVSILAVILIHTTGHDSTAGVVWRQFINFPVAMFFFVAGYFCRYEGDILGFLRKKCLRLIVPLLSFSLLYAVLGLYFGHRLGIALAWQGVLRNLLAFPLGWGYFVVALFQCFCLCPLIIRMSVGKQVAVALGAYLAAYAYCLVGVYLLPECHLFRHMMPYILCLPWLPMFVFGLLVRRRPPQGGMTLAVIATIVFLMLSIAEGLVHYRAGSFELAFTQIKPTSMLFSMALALVLGATLVQTTDLPNRVGMSLLGLLGRYSFFIYLSHRLVLIFIRSWYTSRVGAIDLCVYPLVTIAIEMALVALIEVLPNGLKRRLWFVGV